MKTIVKYYCKALHLRCLREPWIPLWTLNICFPSSLEECQCPILHIASSLQGVMVHLQVVMVNLHTQVKVIFSHSLVSLLFLYYFCIFSGFVFRIILTFIISCKIFHHNFLSYVGQANMKTGEIELSFLDGLLLMVLFCKLYFLKRYLNSTSYNTSYQFTLIESSWCLIIHVEQYS